MHLKSIIYVAMYVGLCVAYLNINNTNRILNGDDLKTSCEIDNNSKNHQLLKSMHFKKAKNNLFIHVSS